MDSLQKLLIFTKAINTSSKGIVVDKLDTLILDSLYGNDKKKHKRFEEINEDRIKEFKHKFDIDLTQNQANLFYAASTLLEWRRPENFSREGYLSGGFAFNGITDLFMSAVDFWEKSSQVFKEVNRENLIDYKLLKDLKWVESTTPYTNSWYTPQFGCVKYKEHTFPDEFYFYDSGILYPLPFKSLAEYIDKLIASSAVRCWQLFYVDPALIIEKNNGLEYITWSLHNSSLLDDRLHDLNFRNNTGFDRLDLIHEYLERCIRLLPTSFPFLDFNYHKKQYTTFLKLYKKNKK